MKKLVCLFLAGLLTFGTGASALAEIAPEMRFPDTGESVAEALHRLEKAEKEERFGENRGVCGENSRKKRS